MKLRSGLITGLAFIMVVTASSCTKEFICECEITYSGQPGLPDTLINEYKLSNTEKKAKEICEKGSSQTTEEGITTIETCKLY